MSTEGLVNDQQINSQCEVHLIIAAGATTSKAILRNSYHYTSVHCAESPVTMQVSNLPAPATDSDRDWFDVDTANYVSSAAPFKWMRAKIATASAQDSHVYVLSIHPTY